MERLKFARFALKNISIALFVLIIPLTLSAAYPSETAGMCQESSHVIPDQDQLVVLWTSGDPETFKSMVFMYTYNAKKNGWWKEITFIIWGPSAKLASTNREIGESLVKIKEIGIDMLACKACADSYACSQDLENLGIDVKYMGVQLTNYIKEGKKVLTF